MELEKIGKFIKQKRKEKNLTQIELAQKLEVSEKTISKWECGNGFPEATLVLPLCKILNISANELLSGEKLTEKEYKEKAEENIVELKAVQEHTTKFLLTIEIVLGLFATLILLGSVLASSFVVSPVWVKIIVIVFGFACFFVGVHFCLVIEKDAGFYECKHCGDKHIPTLKQTYFSMHMGRTRFMKCPKCKKHSWQKKVIK